MFKANNVWGNSRVDVRTAKTKSPRNNKLSGGVNISYCRHTMKGTFEIKPLRKKAKQICMKNSNPWTFKRNTWYKCTLKVTQMIK